MSSTPDHQQDRYGQQDPQDRPDGPVGTPGGVPAGALAVVVQGPAASGGGQVLVTLDGSPVPDPRASAPYAVPPGQHEVVVEVEAQGRRFGRAGLTVQVPPGTTLPVFYEAPAQVGGHGRLGFASFAHATAGLGTAPRTANRGCVWAVVGLAIAIIVLVALLVGVAMISSASASGSAEGAHLSVGVALSPAGPPRSPAGSA